MFCKTDKTKELHANANSYWATSNKNKIILSCLLACENVQLQICRHTYCTYICAFVHVYCLHVYAKLSIKLPIVYTAYSRAMLHC